MQYRDGTVTVTNGSNIVTGEGTLWASEVEDGDIFFKVGDTVSYEVSSVVNDTSLRLSTPFQGLDAAGVPYAISRDFTPLCDIPYPDETDIGTALLFKRAMMVLDTAVNATVKGSPPVQSVTVTSPPATAQADEIWIVPPGATGAWAGETNNIAQLVGTQWSFTAPEPGNRVWVLDQTLEMLFTGTQWEDSTAGLPQIVAMAAQAQTAATSATASATAAAGSATTATTEAAAAQTSATAAAASATTAAAQATAAQGAEAAVAASATNAANSATAAADSATAAAHSASDAAASESAAAGSATSAAASATSASTSAGAASSSASTAQSAATTATGQATLATGAATTATAQASAASASAATASNAATTATGAATTATTQATLAQNSATSAASSATGASASAADSRTSATAASTSATAAAASATAAAASDSDAIAQAAAAAASASTAAGYVNTAQGAATAATTQATGAATSASSAATSASQASASATQAANSASTAQTAASAASSSQSAAAASASSAAAAAAQAAAISGGYSFAGIKDGTNIKVQATGPGSAFNLIQGTGISFTWSTTGVTISSSVTAPTTLPVMNGTAAIGTATAFALEDHVHPVDTSRLAASQTLAVTGDATAAATALSTGTIAVTLAASGVTAGTYNNSATAHTPITVDAKGRITGTAAAVTITPAWGSITGKPTTVSGFGITDALTTAQTLTVTGDATAAATALSTGTIALTLAASGVTAGSYNNSATAITPLTLDAKGRVTATGAAVTITPAWGSITGKPTTIAGYGITDAVNVSQVGANSGLAQLDANGRVPFSQAPTALTSKQVVAPLTGNTVSLSSHLNIINPAGTLASLTFTLPATPADGQELIIAPQQQVTSITFTGGTVVNPPTFLAPGTRAFLTYDTSTAKWYS